jgi:DNA-binding GntR family transcriptional regulator
MNFRERAEREKLKDAIVALVKHSRDPLRPSTLASKLSVPLRLVNELISELIKEGSIGTRPPNKG